MASEIDNACEHAYQLLRRHVEQYREAIVTEPAAWRSRCKELAEDLDWLLFCQAHKLPPKPKKPRGPDDIPPPFIRPRPD